MRSTRYVWVRKCPTALRSELISYRGVISMKRGVWREESLGWTLTFELCSVIFNPWLSLICQRLMRASCKIDEKGKKNCRWGKTRNLFPYLVLISPCWVYFVLTRKQSGEQEMGQGARPKWKMHVELLGAVETCAHRLTMRIDWALPLCLLLFGRFTWSSQRIHVVLIDLMLFWHKVSAMMFVTQTLLSFHLKCILMHGKQIM